MLVHNFTVDVALYGSQFSKNLLLEPFDHSNPIKGKECYQVTDDADGKVLGVFAIADNAEGFTFNGPGFLSDAELNVILERLMLEQANSENWIEPHFEVEAYHQGEMAKFSIIPNEGHFAIELNNQLVAMIEHLEKWEQTAGDELPEDILDKITTAIESQYE
jgi:hypothetical protein